MMTTTTTTDSGAKAATPSDARKNRGDRGDNQNNRGRRIDPAFIWMTVPAAAVFTVLLTIPLLTGPATMSTVVIYAERAQTFWQHAALVGYGVVVALATALCFTLAVPIERALGKTGINVMTRLMGLILAALAVEVMAAGLQRLFPALGAPA